ncbi:MAG: carbonic anhydrase [Rhodospirillales bacterium 20-60-12]|nr:MAG: carbonic anhydrase [Rhodospirillales bacterium 20-60-12]HQT66059.1 carbonic anhydrase [Acetobacteraceae bacterium]
MDQLIEGYRRFRAEFWPADRARYEALAKRGQHPHALVVACADSRVDPQTVFGAVPGELFTLRNVAALVPPYQPDGNHHGTSAGLEFGVRVLKVERIVVLGHAQCGGVQAMIHGAPAEAQDFVEHWMDIAKPALRCEPVEPAGTVAFYEAQVVRLSLNNLMTFPWIASSVAAGNLKLEGFHFDIHTGTLSRLVDGEFVQVT